MAWSTREVAARHRLSQTRIMQIHRKVALWMATMTAVPELTPVQQIRVATEVAVMRTDKLYGEAMRAWTASQQPQAECRGTLGSQPQTLKSRYGDPRYLAMAARITERQLHAAVVGSKAIAAIEARQKVQNSDRREGEAPAEQRAANHHDQITSPLNRACSVPMNSLVYQDQRHDVVLVTNDCDESTCDEVETRRRELLNALAIDTAPVQPPITDANGMQVEEPVLVETVATPRRPLNRQERRARQKLLERKLRKAK